MHRTRARLVWPLILALASLLALSDVTSPGVAAPVMQKSDVCFAEITGDNVTDFSSADASAVQNAVDAVADGGTIRLAGTCAGVQSRGGVTQTLYISRNLTLEGGYTTTWTTPDPDTYPTTFDAESGGRVIYIPGGGYTIGLENLTLTGGNAEEGGGLYNTDGTLTLNTVEVVSNTATHYGGGLYNAGGATTYITNSLIAYNNHTTRLTFYGGGGLYNAHDGALTLKGSMVSNNTTTNYGAGLASWGTLTIIDSTLAYNRAWYGGGIHNYGTLNMENTSLMSNHAGQFGGGLRNDDSITIIGSEITGNTSARGGGIANGDLLTLTASTVAENEAFLYGGGIDNFGTLSINDSTVANNRSDSSGGGLYNDWIATLVNSTVSNNEAQTTGGGVQQDVNGDLSLWHTTVVSNSALTGGDGLHLSGTVTLAGTLLAYNGMENCGGHSTFTSNGYNLEDGDTCDFTATSDITNTDPLLDPLADNGGATLTHLPQTHSPALDVIPSGSCQLSTDQRGESRPSHDGCDIGAVELWLNYTPTAVDDAYTTDEDITLTVLAASGVLTNDSDPEGASLAAYLDSGPSNGSLDLAFDGGFTYTPTQDFNGSDSFTYLVSDAGLDAVAYWPFEEGSGATAYDETYNGNDGMLTNGPTFTTTVPATPTFANSYALSFDGVDDVVAVANSDDINLGTHDLRTVSAWFNVDDDTITTHKQVIWEEGGSTKGLNLYVYDGALYAGGWNKEVWTHFYWPGTWLGPVDVIAGRWHHAALVLDGSSRTFELYLDGMLVAGDMGNSKSMPEHANYIGIGDVRGDTRFHDVDTSNGHPFGGLIDDVRVYNRALSAAEVADAMTDRAPGLTDVGTVTITVSPMNDAPVAVADTYTTSVNTTLTVDAATGILDNDLEVDGDTLTATTLASPSYGALSLSTGGAFVYTPTVDFIGDDRFTYEVSDGVLTSTAAVTINVPSPEVTGTCFAEIHGGSVTDFWSADASAVQNAVDAVADGRTVKLAGTCTGVLSRNGLTQTVFINKNVTLQGGYTTTNWLADPDPALYTTTLDAAGLGRVAYISGTEVTVDGLFVTGGDGTQSGGSLSVASDENGGGIYLESGSALTITGSTLYSNTTGADDYGGALVMSGTISTLITDSTFLDNEAYGGGALYVDGATLRVYTSRFESNAGFGGALHSIAGSAVEIYESAFVENHTTILGGAIYSRGDLTLEDSLFEGNWSESIGGAIEGGNSSAMTTLSNCTFRDNQASATRYGGAINFTGAATVISSTFEGNGAGYAGAIRTSDDLEIRDSLFRENYAIKVNGVGGAIAQSFGDYLAIDNSTFISNTAPHEGGAIKVGNGILITLTHSTLVSNTASYGGALFVDGPAGGTLQNVTLSANEAITSGSGIYNTGTLLLQHATLYGNSSGTSGGGLYNSGVFTYYNTLIAGSTGGDCVNMGTLGGNAGNLVEDGTCSASLSGDPLLKPLADNGGETETHLPQSTSPAIDAGDADTCLATDQRDETRPSGYGCDIGAVELWLDYPPSATDDTYATDEDVVLTVPALGVLANDSDPEGASLAAYLNSGPSNGTLDLNIDGGFTYTPTQEFSGSDSFTYLVSDAGLEAVAYWTFDEGSGTTAYDETYNGNDGTLTEGPTFTTTVPATPTFANDYALAFDGVDDVVAIANSDDINLGTHELRTVSAWFNVDDDTIITHKQVIWEEGGSGKGLNLYIYDGALYAGAWSTSPPWFRTSLGPIDIAPGRWYHAAVVLEADVMPGTLELYLDGELVASGAAYYLIEHANPIGIGRTRGDTAFHNDTYAPEDSPFGGLIDDVRIYNRALSAAEVADAMADRIPGQTDVGTVTITISAVNDAPVAVADAYTMTANTTLTIDAVAGVLNNDTDAEGDALTAVEPTSPANGALSLSTDGAFVYTPTTDFVGNDTFTYAAFDGVLTGTATVTISVAYPEITGSCFAEIHGGNVTDFWSADASAVQEAVDAVADGGTVKLAGTCAGVQTRESVVQTLYIDRSITVQGGYTTTNWLADPDPDTYPTILDAQGGGRVVYITGDITPMLVGLHLTGGDASALTDVGGGIYALTASPTISNCVIYSNTASTNFYGSGGGIYLSTSDALIQNTTIMSNTATTLLQGSGGGLYMAESAATLRGNTFRGNVASTSAWGEGGAVYALRSPATLEGNIVISNTAALDAAQTGRGGGVRLSQCSAFTLTNNVLANNHANSRGGGLAIRGTSTAASTVDLLHNTIADNTGVGQGVYVGDYTTVAFTNTILSGHSGVGITVTAGSAASLEGTLWYANGADTGGTGTILTGTVNVYNDPVFASSSDYHLTATSAAVDAGVGAGVSTDLDGDARDDLAPDAGAYELRYEDSDTVVKYTLPAGTLASFGPTLISVTVTSGDLGTLTVTKHLIAPGGFATNGEMAVTWYITPTGASYLTDLALCYTDAEVVGLDESSLTAYRWNGAQWVAQGGTSHPDDNCVTVANVGAFSAWTLYDTSGGEAPTAVTLRRFGARIPTGPGVAALVILALGAALTFVHPRRRWW